MKAVFGKYIRITVAFSLVFLMTAFFIAPNDLNRVKPPSPEADTMKVTDKGSTSFASSTISGEPALASGSGTGLSVYDFNDVPSTAWYFPYIAPLVETGIFIGTSNTTFEPDLFLSAAQLITLITRYLNIEYRVEEYAEIGIAANKVGSSFWFYGYVAQLVSRGFLKDGEYMLSLDADGLLAISDTSAALLLSPISREKTAELLARSFELDNIPLNSESALPEISAYGHDFIRGGFYPDSILTEYSSLIVDYDDIDKSLLPYVLKCYYNGIFAGDDTGRFNPKASLKRSEAAKLIAAILYNNLRAKTDLRDLDAFAVDDAEYLTDERGVRHISSDGAKRILKAMSGFLSFSVGKTEDDNRLLINEKSVLPDGYTVEVFISRYLYGVNYRAYYLNMSVPGSHTETSRGGKQIKLSYNGSPCEATVLFLLRNLDDDGNIEAIYELRITKELKLEPLAFEYRDA